MPYSKYNHILRYWRLNLQHINFRRDTIQSTAGTNNHSLFDPWSFPLHHLLYLPSPIKFIPEFIFHFCPFIPISAATLSMTSFLLVRTSVNCPYPLSYISKPSYSLLKNQQGFSTSLWKKDHTFRPIVQEPGKLCVKLCFCLSILILGFIQIWHLFPQITSCFLNTQHLIYLFLAPGIPVLSSWSILTECTFLFSNRLLLISKVIS